MRGETGSKHSLFRVIEEARRRRRRNRSSIRGLKHAESLEKVCLGFWELSLNFPWMAECPRICRLMHDAAKCKHRTSIFDRLSMTVLYIYHFSFAFCLPKFVWIVNLGAFSSDWSTVPTTKCASFCQKDISELQRWQIRMVRGCEKFLPTVA